MAKNLYTIGYESCEIDEFVAGLVKSGIGIVADVRKNPVSRKPGFAKSRLAAKLYAVDIEYMHLPALGVPTEWRKLAKAELITRRKMFQDYKKKILPKAGEEISRLQLLVKKSKPQSKLAVLCYEADATDCHRTFVAEKVTTREHIRDLDMLEIVRKLRTVGRKQPT